MVSDYISTHINGSLRSLLKNNNNNNKLYCLIKSTNVTITRVGLRHNR